MILSSKRNVTTEEKKTVLSRLEIPPPKKKGKSKRVLFLLLSCLFVLSCVLHVSFFRYILLRRDIIVVVSLFVLSRRVLAFCLVVVLSREKS